MHDLTMSGPGEGDRVRSFRRRLAKVGALLFALTAASPSIAESATPAAQPGVVIFWNATKLMRVFALFTTALFAPAL